METMNYTEMSNSELKLQLEILENLFESKKNSLTKVCAEMNDIEREYLSVKRELEIRRNIYL